MVATKPHIVLLTSWYPSREHPFAGVFVQAQAQALAAAGCKVGVVSVEFCEAASHDENREEEGLSIFQHCAHASTPNKKRIFWFGAYQREQKRLFQSYVAEHGAPDLVNIEGLWPAGRASGWLAQQGIPCVVTEHSEEYLSGSTRRLLRTPLMLKRVLLPAARSVVSYSTPSAFLARALAETGVISSAQAVHVIPNTVPLRNLEIRPSEGLLFVHASSFSPAKNIPMLLDAFRQVLDSYPDAKLELIGDSEFRSGTEEAVQTRGLSESVQFTGYLTGEQLAEHLAAAAAAVLASRYETFSSFAAEALVVGCPVVTTPCGGPEEFIGEGDGLVSPAPSCAALAETWKMMAATYRGYDRPAIRDRAAARFAPAPVAAQFIAWYEEVLGR